MARPTIPFGPEAVGIVQHDQREIPAGEPTLTPIIASFSCRRLALQLACQARCSMTVTITPVDAGGEYTIDTDGKLGKVEFSSLAPQLHGGGDADSRKPPDPRG
jgi:hypothetical protein